MSLRARIFIIVSVLVLLTLGISIILVVGKKDKIAGPDASPAAPLEGVVKNSGQSTGQAPVGDQAPAGLPAKTASPLEAQKNGVAQLAKIFVERYGTYSTDNDFQNIKDVEMIVTKSLWSKIRAPMTSKTINQDFVGVTTKVVSMNLTNWSEIKAIVELKTTRTEEKNGTVTARYQDVVVEMVKENGLWLADKLVWK